MEEKILEGLPYLISYPKEFCKNKKYLWLSFYTVQDLARKQPIA